MSRARPFRCRGAAGPLALRAIGALLPAGSGWTAAAIDRSVASGEVELLVLIRRRPGAPAVVCGCVLWRTVVPQAEILQVAVRHACRGRGIGSGMLAACMAVMRPRGVREVFLEVASGNRAARALYRSAGFRTAGRRNGYYGKDDALVMLRTVSPRVVSRQPVYVRNEIQARQRRRNSCCAGLTYVVSNCTISDTPALEDQKHG